MLKPIIVGVDSGVTNAYAIFDINGSLIRAVSARGIDTADIALDIIRYGKVCLVGVDVRPSTAFGKRIASCFGAKLVVPRRRLSVKEKRILARGYLLKNKHEADAVAAGLNAYKKARKLLNAVDVRLKKRGKAEYSEIIKCLLLTKRNLNIERALRIAEGR